MIIAIRRIIDFVTKVLYYAGRGRGIRVDRYGTVRINLGCGLSVEPGWINVDGSLNALVAGWPKPVHHWLYNLSGAIQYFSWLDNWSEKSLFVEAVKPLTTEC